MVRELLESGWKMNEIMESLLYYMVKVLNDKYTEPMTEERQEAILDAF